MKARSEAGEAILVVEPDRTLRTGIARPLAAAGYKVDELESGEQVLAEARQRRPRLVILGIRLPGMSGYEACQALRDDCGRELPIMFVSAQRRSSDRSAGLVLGADDWVVAPFAADELLARVRRLACNSGPRVRRSDSTLTTREREVIGLLAQGLDPREVAHRLFISPKTVGTHVEHILFKLEVHSRSQAIAYAYRAGLVDPGATLSSETARRSES